MSAAGFIDKYLDNANKFYELAMKQFDLYLKIMGTDVTIIRIKDESLHKEVYGPVYTSNLLNDDDLIKIKYRILLNINDMVKVWSQVSDQFEIYDNREIIKLGDVIQFSRTKKQYNFKVTSIESFSEAERVIYKYTLVGYQEVVSLQ